MVDLGEDEEKFDAFMMPLTQSFESLGQVLLNQSSGYNSEEVKLDHDFRYYGRTNTFSFNTYSFLHFIHLLLLQCL